MCVVQLVREKLFKRLYKEVPYKLDIHDVSVRYLRDGSIRIEKDIMVACEEVSRSAHANLPSLCCKTIHTAAHWKFRPAQSHLGC